MPRCQYLIFAALGSVSLAGCADARPEVSNVAQITPVAQNSTAEATETDSAPAPGKDASTFGGELASKAADAKVPTGVRALVPRGASTQFCFTAQMDNRQVLVYGWNRSKKMDASTTVDILARARAKKGQPATYTRLNRLDLGPMLLGPGAIELRVTPLQKSGHGVVMSLQWGQENVSAFEMTMPMQVFVLPDGIAGRVISKDYTTTSSTGGNEYYKLYRDQDGTAFLVKHESFFDANQLDSQRFSWNGRTFEAGQKVTQKLQDDTNPDETTAQSQN